MNKSISWKRRASYPYFERFCRQGARWFFALALLCAIPGLLIGYIFAPVDAVQGESYRLMFVHVPTSWVAMIAFVAMAFWSAVYLVWRVKTAMVMVYALIPTGTLMAFLSLATGALWGKPTWGTFWVWDARLTSMLLLLFLYIGVQALKNSMTQEKRRRTAVAVWSIVGVINVPIIYFSVMWWNTLHQGASISVQGGVKMNQLVLIALLFMTAAIWSYAIAAVLTRARLLVLEEDMNKRWVQDLLSKHPS